jgi:hypothetical protein
MAEAVTEELNAPLASPSAAEPEPGSAEAIEADDQLAMFGAISPTDPAPTKRSRRRSPPAGDAQIAAEKPKRARRAARSVESGRRRGRRTAKA